MRLMPLTMAVWRRMLAWASLHVADVPGHGGKELHPAGLVLVGQDHLGHRDLTAVPVPEGQLRPLPDPFPDRGGGPGLQDQLTGFLGVQVQDL